MLNEPTLTFNPHRKLLYVNAVSLEQLPDWDYALLLISSSEKRLKVFPCVGDERDAVRLRSAGKQQNKPRQIRCLADFSEKMLSLMEWKHDCRYKTSGYVAVRDNVTMIVFDLSSAKVFQPNEHLAEREGEAVDLD
jgi:hypothetical protein